jgi:Flp pilus assembly pilin Flp
MRFVPAAKLRTLWIVDDGQDMLEYALMAGFLAVLAAASIPAAAESVSRAFAAIVAVLNGVAGTVG